MGIGYLGSLDDLFLRGILHTEDDVVVEGVIEKDSFLIYVSHQFSQFIETHFADIGTGNEEFSFCHIIEAGDEIYQSRLS